jgi:hypothetical protein
MAVSTSTQTQIELPQDARMELALKGDDAVPTRFEHLFLRIPYQFSRSLIVNAYGSHYL